MSNNFKFGNLTDTGLVRKANEDYYGCFETANGYIFVVCDGMGGHVGGAVASQTAVEAIMEFFNAALYENTIVSMQNALVAANNAILQKIIETPELDGMGTTCVLLIIKNDTVYYAHIGDSRIYYLHNQTLQRITADHSFVQTLVDAGHITETEAELHPKKNQITKALGIAKTIEPTICNNPILPVENDMFLLCSDGLTGMVADAFISKVLTDTTNDLQQKATALIMLANNNGGVDNVTAQVIRFSNTANPINPILRNITAQNTSIFYPKTKNRRGLGLGLAIVLLLGIAGFGGYNYFKKDKEIVEVELTTEQKYKVDSVNNVNKKDSNNIPNEKENSIHTDSNDSLMKAESEKFDDQSNPERNIQAHPKETTKYKKVNTTIDYPYQIKAGDKTTKLEKLFGKPWSVLKKEAGYTDKNPLPNTTLIVKVKSKYEYNDVTERDELIINILKNKEAKKEDLIILEEEKVILIPKN